MGGDQPLIHGKIEQPPAGFTCPYTQEVLIFLISLQPSRGTCLAGTFGTIVWSLLLQIYLNRYLQALTEVQV